MTLKESDVSGVLGSTNVTNFEPFIGAAKRLYDDRLGTQSVDDETYDDVVAQLAAHLIASGRERQYSSASEGGGTVSFEGETGMGLDGTTYGQTAKLLDPTGQLEGADAPSVSLDVVDLTE